MLPNWIPFEVGGGTSRYEAAHRALREAVGSLAGPEDGLEDAWRFLRAAAIVDAASLIELAVVQGLPNLATAHIPVYESLLRVVPGPDDDDVGRRQKIVEIWTAEIGADYPALRASIQAIDPNADLDAIPEQFTTTTRFGRMYASRPWDGSYGPNPNFTATQFPNFSTWFLVTVRYILQPGQISPPEESKQRIADLLNTSLPSWVDWYVHTGSGFFTDGGVDGQSLLNSKLL